MAAAAEGGGQRRHVERPGRPQTHPNLVARELLERHRDLDAGQIARILDEVFRDLHAHAGSPTGRCRHLDPGHAPVGRNLQPRQDFAEQPPLANHAVRRKPLRDRVGCSPGVDQIRRRSERLRGRIPVSEAAGVGEDGRVEVRRRVAGDRQTHRPEQAEDHLSCRGRLRLDPVQVAEPRVSHVVVHVQDHRTRPSSVEQTTRPAEGGGVHHQVTAIVVIPGQHPQHLARAGQLPQLGRNGIGVEGPRAFPRLAEREGRGQRRTDGISLRVHVRQHRHRRGLLQRGRHAGQVTHRVPPEASPASGARRCGGSDPPNRPPRTRAPARSEAGGCAPSGPAGIPRQLAGP